MSNVRRKAREIANQNKIEHKAKILAENLKKQNDDALYNVLEEIIKFANLNVDVNNIYVNKDNIVNEFIKRIEVSNQFEKFVKDRTDFEAKYDLLEQVNQDLQTKLTNFEDTFNKQDLAYEECTENLVKCIEVLNNSEMNNN